MTTIEEQLGNGTITRETEPHIITEALIQSLTNSVALTEGRAFPDATKVEEEYKYEAPVRLLVKWSDNWADEMDLDGFKLFTSREAYDDFLAQAKEVIDKGRWIFYLGTNEEIEYDDFERFKKTLDASLISESTFQEMVKLFPRMDYGFFPDPEDQDNDE